MIQVNKLKENAKSPVFAGYVDDVRRDVDLFIWQAMAYSRRSTLRPGVARHSMFETSACSRMPCWRGASITHFIL